MFDLLSRLNIQRSYTQTFKEKERFVNMAFKFSVSKFTIVFKIALSKLTDSYPRIKNSLLCLKF